jgi:Family of unknown function (DUF5691)
MNDWETCVSTALIGVNRQSPSIHPSHPVLANYEPQIQAQLPGAQLLAIASLLSAYQKAGQRIPQGQYQPEPAMPQDFPPCDGHRAFYCRSVLIERPTAQSRQLLPELLQLLKQSNRSVPYELLPALLDWGRSESQLRSAILPILGNRGRWLANQNSHWAYARAAEDRVTDLAEVQNQWETGKLSERLAALQTWRREQPNEARQALGKCWNQEKASDRQSYLEVLSIGLSQEDEEFLEKSLSDRAMGVRQKAASLLGQIPSRYRRRIGQIAVQWLHIEAAEQGCRAQITLPKTVQAEWLEEGLSDRLPQNNLLVTDMPSWLLLQVLIATDLYRWGADLDVTPESLIRAALNLRYHNVLILSGWATAAIHQHRLDWVRALLECAGNLLPESDLLGLLQSLPNDQEREHYLLCLMKAERSASVEERSMLMLLGHFPMVWNEELSRIVVQKIGDYLKRSGDRWQAADEDYHHLCIEAGYHLDSRLLPAMVELRALFQESKIRHQPPLDKCIEILEFCGSMRLAFFDSLNAAIPNSKF